MWAGLQPPGLRVHRECLSLSTERSDNHHLFHFSSLVVQLAFAVSIFVSCTESFHLTSLSDAARSTNASLPLLPTRYRARLPVLRSVQSRASAFEQTAMT